MDSIATAKNRGQRKAIVTVSVGSGNFISGDDKWHTEEGKRLRDKQSALEKELEDFDEDGAAQKVKDGLNLELARTKLDLAQHELRKP